jgi:hypothetical protein
MLTGAWQLSPMAEYGMWTACSPPHSRHIAMERRFTMVPCVFESSGTPVELGGVTIHDGDVLHANAEGVILIPKSCLEALPARAVQMLAFENEAHIVLRRTDVQVAEKRSQVASLLERYGFAK